jgi:hypothetical protein
MDEPVVAKSALAEMTATASAAETVERMVDMMIFLSWLAGPPGLLPGKLRQQ